MDVDETLAIANRVMDRYKNALRDLAQMKSDALAVCVVRLQVPQMHTGHHYLLKSILAIHNNVLVVIGETEARLTAEDPLTFEMRKAMLLSVYPTVTVASLRDQPSDKLWSEDLDLLIDQQPKHILDAGKPTLYGGRDSFLSHYQGRHRTFELPYITTVVSGTGVREAVGVKHSPDFREGMIYASKHKYPVSYQCVDVAILDQENKVLLGQKKTDAGLWRFVGGFVAPTDTSLEYAARREVREELGVEPGDAVYIGSAQVHDHRYPESGTDRLLSALFTMQYSFGSPQAADDLDVCKWFNVDDVYQNLITEHRVLFSLLRRHLDRKKTDGTQHPTDDR